MPSKSIKEFESFVRNKERPTGFLCNMRSPILQQMLENLLADETATLSNRSIVLQKDTKKTMG